MKNTLTPAGIEPVTIWFVAQHLFRQYRFKYRPAIPCNFSLFSSSSPGVPCNTSQLPPTKSLTTHQFWWSLYFIQCAMISTADTAEVNWQWTAWCSVHFSVSGGHLPAGVSTKCCECYLWPICLSFMTVMWWRALFQVPDRKPAEWREQCWGIYRCIETGLPLCGMCVCLFCQHQR